MKERELHAVLYEDARGEGWVAHCIEYDITSDGDTPEEALSKLKEKTELHFDGISPEAIEDIDNEVGSEPYIKAFSVRAPSLLNG
jgi:predicted RNase H-like HicB family nuclease